MVVEISGFHDFAPTTLTAEVALPRGSPVAVELAMWATDVMPLPRIILRESPILNDDSWLCGRKPAIRTGDDASVDIQVDATHVLAATLRFVLRPVLAGATPFEDIDAVGLSRLAEDGVNADSKEGDIHLLCSRSTKSGAGSVVGFAAQG